MQGHTQTEAISKVFDIEELRVYDVYRPAAEKFAEDMKDVVKGKIIICNTIEEVTDDLILSCDEIEVDHVGQTLHRGALKELVKQGKLSEKDVSVTIGELVLCFRPYKCKCRQQ